MKRYTRFLFSDSSNEREVLVRKVSLLVGVLTLALTACHPFESLDDPFAGVDLNTDTQGANEDITVDITPPT